MKHYSIFFLQALFVLQLIGIKPVNGQQKTVGQDSIKICFYEARKTLNDMLSGKIKPNYEKAVFITENAYLGNKMSYSIFDKYIDYHALQIQRMAGNMNVLDTTKPTLKYPTDNIVQKKAKREKLQINWAIYTYMTDTTFSFYGDTLRWHQPYYYSTTDPFGTKEWANTQVLNLLNTHTGNCYAMASLYKIFSDKLQADATIATSIGHAFIRHQDDNGITYNVELASREFPGSGTIETLTYTTNDAIKNGIAMRSLTDGQAIGMCLIYLAKGYENKFQAKDDDFILGCAELALKYDSLNLNAMLLKAEVLEEKVLDKHKHIAQIRNDKIFREYENLIRRIYVLGYREMPIEMQNILLSRLNQDGYMTVTNHTPQPFANLKVSHASYATISNGLFEEEIKDKPIEKYHHTLFDTKTKQIVQFANTDSTYDNYTTDPVILAWSIDPLAGKLPGISPYSCFSDNPTNFIDVDGRFPYKVTVRSFAPPGAFKFTGFSDDNRGFTASTAKDVTSRIQQNYVVDPTAKTFSGVSTTSDPTKFHGVSETAQDAGNATPEFGTNSMGSSTASVSSHYEGSNPFFAGAAPNISTSSIIGLTEDLKLGKLFVSIDVSSKQFPATEAIIQDASGQSLLLAGAAAFGNPTDLVNAKEKNVASVDITVNINNKGIFQSVTVGDKTYSVSDFNKLTTSKSAGPKDRADKDKKQ